MPQFILEADFKALRADPDALAARADAVVAELQYEAEKLRARAESEAIVREQTCAQLEQRYLALEEEYSQMEGEQRRLQAALAEASAELAEARTHVLQEQASKVSIDSEAERLRLEVSELRTARRNFQSLLEQKNQEIVEKDIAIKSYLDKIVVLTETRAAAEGQMRAAEESQQRLHTANARLVQEKELLEQHTGWLTAELAAKSGALAQERQGAAERQAELATEAAALRKSASASDAAATRAKERVVALEGQLEQAQRKHREATGAAAERERRFTEELQTAHKLVELHKESRQDAEAKFKELKGVAAAIEEALSSQKVEFEQRLEEEARLREASSMAAQAERRKLAKELQEARDTLAQQRSSDPLTLTVATTRQAGDGAPQLALDLRSDTSDRSRQLLQLSPIALGAMLIKDGATLTDMYARYQEAADAFRHETQERTRVEQEYNRLVAEINERLPTLITEQATFRSLEGAYQTLLQKHADAGVREREMQAQLTALQAQLERSSREKQGLERHATDLQREVAHLLKESQAEGRLTGGTGAEVAAPGTPPQHEEWAFQDIHELVTKYEQVKLRYENLQQEHDHEKEHIQEQARAEVDAAYEHATKQVQEIRHRLQVREDAMAEIQKQAAMYERLWRSAEPRQAGTGMGAEEGELENDQLAVARKAQKALEDAQAEAEREKNELLKKMDDARRAVLDAEVAQKKAEAGVEFEREQYGRLEGQFQEQAQELEASRQRHLEFMTSINEFQKQLRNKDNDRQEALDAARRLETQVAILEKEKSLLVAAEARASNEAAALSQKMHQAQAQLEATRIHHDTQAEATSAERKRLLEEVQRLQHEWRDARTELEGERQRCRTLTLERDQATQEAAQRVKVAEDAAEAAKKAAAETGAQEVAANARVTALEKELQQTDTKLRAAIRGEAGSSGDTEADREALVLAELERARTQLRNVTEDLVAAQRHVEQYKTIAAANETTLQQATEEHRRFREAAQQAQAAIEAEAEGLRGRMARLEGELAAAKEAAEQREKAGQAEEEAVQRERQVKQEELGRTQRELQEAEARVGALKDEVERTRQQYTRAQAHYQQQVLAQAEAIRAQNEAVAKLQAAEDEAKTAKSRAEAAEQLKASSEVAWAAEKSALAAQQQAAERKAAELEQQNRILLDRLEARHNTALSPPHVGTEQAGEQEGDIQNVLRYLRREKETVETALQLAQQEAARWCSQAERASKAAEEARAELAVMAERAHRSLQHEDQHRALLAQVEQLNLLRESNSALREEAAGNLREVTRWRTLASEGEAAVGALKSELRDKEAAAEGAARERDLAQQEADRWKARADQLTKKFEAVDPVEHQRLVEELASVQGQLRAANEGATAHAAQLEASQQQVASLEAQVEKSKETQESDMQRYRATLRKMATDAKEAKEKLEQQVTDLEIKLKAAESAPSRWQNRRLTSDDAKKEVETAKAAAEEGKKEAEAAKREAEAAKREGEAGRKEAEAARKELEAARKEVERLQQEVADAKKAEEQAKQEAAGAKRAADEEKKEGAGTAEDAAANQKANHDLEMRVKAAAIEIQRAEVAQKEAEQAFNAEKKKLQTATGENKKLVSALNKARREKVALDARVAALEAQLASTTKAPAAAAAQPIGEERTAPKAEAQAQPNKGQGPAVATTKTPPAGKATENPPPKAAPAIAAPATAASSPAPPAQEKAGMERPSKESAEGLASEVAALAAEVPPIDGTKEKNDAAAHHFLAKLTDLAQMEASTGQGVMSKEAPPQQAPSTTPAVEEGGKEKEQAGGTAQGNPPAEIPTGTQGAAPAAAPPSVSTVEGVEANLRRELLARKGSAGGSPSAPAPAPRRPTINRSRAAPKLANEEGVTVEARTLGAGSASPAKRPAQAAPPAASNKRARSADEEAALPEAQRRAREAAANALRPSALSRGGEPGAAPPQAAPVAPVVSQALTPATPVLGSRLREAEVQEGAPLGKRLRVEAPPFVPQPVAPLAEVRSEVAAQLVSSSPGGVVAGSQRERVEAVAQQEVVAQVQEEAAQVVAMEEEKSELKAEAVAREDGEAEAPEAALEVVADGAEGMEEELGGGEVGPQELEPGDMEQQRQPLQEGEDVLNEEAQREGDKDGDMVVDLQTAEEGGEAHQEQTGRGEEEDSAAPAMDVEKPEETGNEEETKRTLAGSTPAQEGTMPVVNEENVSLLGLEGVPTPTAEQAGEKQEREEDAGGEEQASGLAMGQEAFTPGTEGTERAAPREAGAGSKAASHGGGDMTPSGEEEGPAGEAEQEEKAAPKALKKSQSKGKKGLAKEETGPEGEGAAERGDKGAGPGGEVGAPSKVISLVKVHAPPTTHDPRPLAMARKITSMAQGAKQGRGRAGTRGRGGGGRGSHLPSPRSGQKKQTTVSPPKRNTGGKKDDKGQNSNRFDALPEDE